MQSTESAFRESEMRFDAALEGARYRLEAAGLAIVDRSLRTYRFKNSWLSWDQSFTREWDQDIHTAQVNRHGFGGGSNSREWSHVEVPEVFFARGCASERCTWRWIAHGLHRSTWLQFGDQHQKSWRFEALA